MTEGSNLPDSFAATVFKTIREYVEQNDPEGLKYFQSFESALGTEKESAGKANFEGYLRELISRDQNILNQLESSLSGNKNFINIVTGGQVEKIINIAQAGAVHIHQPSFLITHRSFVLLLMVIGVVLSTTGGVYWYVKQPVIADPEDFYIAVADFKQTPPSSDQSIGQSVSQSIFDYLDTQYQLREFDYEIMVEHKNIGEIEGGIQAKELADKINADVVIFGTINLIGNSMTITPKFYIAETLRPDISELTGSHQLTMPIVTFVENQKNGVPLGEILQDRSEILISFTKALTFLAANTKAASKANLRESYTSIQDAIEEAETYSDLPDIEVLYLFASHISRLLGNYQDAQIYIDKALSENLDYGRAYIAQANIYYDQLDFENALSFYQKALELEDQKNDYLLAEKAHLGIGNIRVYQFQTAPESEKEDLADVTLKHYQEVIDSYEEEKNPRIREMAALAHYSSGIVYHFQNNEDPACAHYSISIELTVSENLKKLASDRMSQINCPEDS